MSSEDVMKDPNIFPIRIRKGYGELLRLNDVDMRNNFEQYKMDLPFLKPFQSHDCNLAACASFRTSECKMFFDTNANETQKTGWEPAFPIISTTISPNSLPVSLFMLYFAPSIGSTMSQKHHCLRTRPHDFGPIHDEAKISSSQPSESLELYGYQQSNPCHGNPGYLLENMRRGRQLIFKILTPVISLAKSDQFANKR
jgi:hypothetical protein